MLNYKQGAWHFTCLLYGLEPFSSGHFCLVLSPWPRGDSACKRQGSRGCTLVPSCIWLTFPIPGSMGRPCKVLLVALSRCRLWRDWGQFLLQCSGPEQEGEKGDSPQAALSEAQGSWLWLDYTWTASAQAVIKYEDTGSKILAEWAWSCYILF